MSKNEEGFSPVEIILAIVVVALIGVTGWLIYKDHNKVSISSFQQCAAKYPVEQSYPEVCQVPNGKSFTNTNQKPLVFPHSLPTSSTSVPTPTAVASVADCTFSDLSGKLTQGSGGAAGNDTSDILLTNTSNKTCTLDGYLSLQMQDSSYNAIALTSSHGGGMLISDPGPSLITLSPGGVAVTGISFAEGGDNSCYTPAYIKVTLPNVSDSATLQAGSYLYICSSYSITAIQSGSTPASAD